MVMGLKLRGRAKTKSRALNAETQRAQKERRKKGREQRRMKARVAALGVIGSERPQG